MSGTEDQDRVDGAVAVAALDDLLGRLRRHIELDLRVAMPARVVTYNPTTQKAVVRLELLPVREVKGTEVPDLPVILQQIPVRWPRTAAGYITLPLAPNDTGHVVFTDRALAVWLATGNAASAVDPINGRTHNLADAFFEPGLHTDTDPIAPPTAADATVIEGPLVRAGAAAAQFVALASLVEAQLNALKAAISAAPTTAADGGAGFKASLVSALASWPATMASTKLQAQ